jgi:hypothetical protein
LSLVALNLGRNSNHGTLTIFRKNARSCHLHFLADQH